MARKRTAESIKGPPWWRSSRYLIAFLAAFGYACFFLQRVNLSLAIVCMVNHTAVDILKAHREIGFPDQDENGMFQAVENSTWSTAWLGNQHSTLSLNFTIVDLKDSPVSNGDECSSRVLDEIKKEDGELVWPKEIQGLLLSGLFWGYFLLNLPAQKIITITGSKKLALGSVLLLSGLSIISPVAARLHVWALMTIRVVQGFATALGVSALYAIVGTWAPLEERATLLAIVFTGNMLANAVVFPTSGFLCRHGFAGGWPSVFYVFGIIGLLWCVLWTFLVFENPEVHPRIHPLEKKYILSHNSASNQNRNTVSVPWLKLCKSMPVWAVVTSTIGYTYPFFLFMSVLPQYMKEVLNFDIQSNGFFVMLPYISLFMFSNIWAHICKIFMAKRLLSVACIRNLSAIIGDVIPCSLYVIISFLGCNQATVIVFLMALAVGISGANLQSYLVNPYDIAPKYAVAIFCFSNTLSVGSGIISPYVVAALTADKTREQWQRVFFSTVGVSLACLLFYLVFGSSREMDWAKEVKRESELDDISVDKSPNQNDIVESKSQNLLDEKENVEDI